MERKTDAQVGCVIMAAGNARRFGSNKLLQTFGGKCLIQWVLETAQAAPFAQVVVVSQYRQILELARTFGYRAVENVHPEYGVSHTIALGTAALQTCDAIAYLVSDQPLLRAETLQRLVQAWQQNPACIVAAAHGGVRGNPCIFPKTLFPELLQLHGDVGGSRVAERYPGSVQLVEVLPDELFDCDTPQMLQWLQEQKI